MLEKTLGVTLVTKLQAILLMEADFNATNKILYGVRMMGQARSYNFMPDEIYSKKTEWLTMVPLQKHSSLTRCDDREYRQPSHQLTLQTAMIEFPTRLPPSSNSPLASLNQPLDPCLRQSRT